MVVAAVLHLEEVAGTLVRGRAEAEGTDVLRMSTDDACPRGLRSFVRQVGSDVELFLRPDDQVNTLDTCHLVGAKLGVAPRDDDEGTRMLACSLANHRTALLVCQLRDRTGIDDADVCYLTRAHAPHALGQEGTPDGRSLSEVELAPQRVVGGFLVFEDGGVSHCLGEAKRRI